MGKIITDNIQYAKLVNKMGKQASKQDDDADDVEGRRKKKRTMAMKKRDEDHDVGDLRLMLAPVLLQLRHAWLSNLITRDDRSDDAFGFVLVGSFPSVIRSPAIFSSLLFFSPLPFPFLLFLSFSPFLSSHPLSSLIHPSSPLIMFLHIGSRSNAAHIDLSDILEEEVEKEVKTAAEISMGTEINEEDIVNVKALAYQVIAISDYRTTLFEYLRNRYEFLVCFLVSSSFFGLDGAEKCSRSLSPERLCLLVLFPFCMSISLPIFCLSFFRSFVSMAAIAPNLTMLVGELVGARLIAHAGSLVNLAKHPASTVQILGAEKALFRALKTKHETPKYGLIYHASLVGQTSAKNKGKVSAVREGRSSLIVLLQLEQRKGHEAKMIWKLIPERTITEASTSSNLK